MVRGRARGGKGSLCPPPPTHPKSPRLDPPPSQPTPLDPHPMPPPPPPPSRGLRPTVSWGDSWRPKPRGRPPPGLITKPVDKTSSQNPFTTHHHETPDKKTSSQSLIKRLITKPHNKTSSQNCITKSFHKTTSHSLITKPHHITLSQKLITKPHYQTTSQNLITTPHHKK